MSINSKIIINIKWFSVTFDSIQLIITRDIYCIIHHSSLTIVWDLGNIHLYDYSSEIKPAYFQFLKTNFLRRRNSILYESIKSLRIVLMCANVNLYMHRSINCDKNLHFNSFWLILNLTPYIQQRLILIFPFQFKSICLSHGLN